jgi:predicted ATPase
LKGEILIEGIQGAEGEACIERAMALAHAQGARMLELRAATSLARVWERTGRSLDARRVLAGLYSGFTEGFETPDLRAARELLDRLERHGHALQP